MPLKARRAANPSSSRFSLDESRRRSPSIANSFDDLDHHTQEFAEDTLKFSDGSSHLSL